MGSSLTPAHTLRRRSRARCDLSHIERSLSMQGSSHVCHPMQDDSAGGKKTGPKKRWFVVEDNLLYYYASKTVRHSPTLPHSATVCSHVYSQQASMLGLRQTGQHAERRDPAGLLFHLRAAEPERGQIPIRA
jgi:hypothetical protein